MHVRWLQLHRNIIYCSSPILIFTSQVLLVPVGLPWASILGAVSKVCPLALHPVVMPIPRVDMLTFIAQWGAGVVILTAELWISTVLLQNPTCIYKYHIEHNHWELWMYVASFILFIYFIEYHTQWYTNND